MTGKSSKVSIRNVKNTTKTAQTPPSSPKPIRIPITQEFMVQSIIAERGGAPSQHPISNHFPNLLVQSVEKMVRKVAESSAAGTPESGDDLAQECLRHMWNKLDKYNPDRGKFTTWVTTISRNLLSRSYRKMKKRRSIIFESDKAVEFMGSSNPHKGEVLCSDIGNAILELVKRYPTRKDVLFAMFGDPSDIAFPNSTICFARTARESGVPASDVSYFYKKKVMPFLRNRLKTRR